MELAFLLRHLTLLWREVGLTGGILTGLLAARLIVERKAQRLPLG